MKYFDLEWIEFNLRLADAAPDLLEALKDIVADRDDTTSMGNITETSINKARAAIKKAEERTDK